MDNQIGKANLEVFSETLLQEAKLNNKIVVVTSDSRGSGKLVPFGKQLPYQLIEVGIAEQNLVGVCAGLSAAGKKVFGVSPSSFLTARSLEQIKNDIAYSNQPVVLVGISAGISYGSLGATHHSIHDFAVLRTINNITIVSPADNFESSEVIKKSLNYDKPLFIRYGKKPTLNLHKEGQKFEIGKAIIINQGEEIAFIATGETVQRAYLASQILKEQGLNATVISMHTIKPFDKDTFLEAISNAKVLISLEEHSVYGGLGEMCASIIAQEKININFKILGIPDEYMINGSQSEVLDYYDMEPKKLSRLAKIMIDK
ncbi:MAG: transketolase family protein [Alphaproteobacteria bacterium]|jgi:transketolase|tara:strand:+ start:10573 stop:11517 length:945 start_codon:yes stop_codon:yes gene_type:complete